MQQISSAAFSDTKPHYELLDGLRGVAALLVSCLRRVCFCRWYSYRKHQSWIFGRGFLFYFIGVRYRLCL